jgi:hypothetical protein
MNQTLRLVTHTAYSCTQSHHAPKHWLQLSVFAIGVTNTANELFPYEILTDTQQRKYSLAH